jgi:hypothetical protein
VHTHDVVFATGSALAVAVWHDPQLDLVADGSLRIDRELVAKRHELRRSVVRLIGAAAVLGLVIGLLVSGVLHLGG